MVKLYKGGGMMNDIRMYILTIIEITIFLFIGFFLSQYGISKIYEAMGILYLGNIGVIWFGLSFVLFSLYTLLRNFVLFQKSLVLKN
jgi:hypothetical protein